MTTEDPVTAAALRAADIAASIKAGGDLQSAYHAADVIAAEYQAAYGNLKDVLPATNEIGQGFTAGKIPSGRSIVRAFMDALSADLCDPKAELNQRIRHAADVGSAALIGWLLAALGLSAAAALLLAPIAGAIIALGLPAYCAATRRK